MARASTSLPVLGLLLVLGLTGGVRAAGAQQNVAYAHGSAILRGTVVDESGAIVPRVTVTVTSVDTGVVRAALDGPSGTFVVPLLPPGQNFITARRRGFATVEVRNVVLRHADQVLVRIRLEVEPFHQLVTVAAGQDLVGVALAGVAELPGASTTTLRTRFTAQALADLPNARSLFDALETVAGITNRGAFGAGGNVEGYDIFGWGAATNAYQLNGVPINNLEFGNAWVCPNYDTVEEIHVVGPGAAAEHAHFTGALVNLITKSGTNAYRGGVTGWYTGSTFRGDNSDGIVDFLPDRLKYRTEAAFHLGGPILRDRLLFFGSVAHTLSSSAPHRDPTAPAGTPVFYDSLHRRSYQGRADFLGGPKHRVSAFFNSEPIENRNLGLTPGSGTEVGYWRDWSSTLRSLSWQATWSHRTVTDVKLATSSGHHARVPNAPDDIPAVIDMRRGGRQYGSAGFRRDQENVRRQALASTTHYVERFLGAEHQAKWGAEYEQSAALTDLRTSGNALFYLFPYSPGVTYAWGATGYNQHQSTRVRRFSGYVQDEVRVTPRSAVTLGVRYDAPSLVDGNTGRRLMAFDHVALRGGFSYDLSGNGRTVVRGGYGRYYEKVPTYGPGAYGGTGNSPVTYYRLVTPETLDPAAWHTLQDLLIQPSNVQMTFATSARPVAAGLRNPKTDALNLGFEKQIASGLGVSLSYLFKRSDDFIALGTSGDLLFEPHSYTHPYNGQPLQLYNWVNQDVVRDDQLANVDAFHQRNHMAIAEVRGRTRQRVTFLASLTWERSTGTRENNECAVLSLCTNGVDKDPNYTRNPFHHGLLMANRTWQLKVNATARIPGQVTATGEYRWLSGHPWGARDRAYSIPGFDDPAYIDVLLEPKDARRQPSVSALNLRLGKTVTRGRLSATVLLDVLNAFNEGSPAGTAFHRNLTDRFTYTFDANGEPASAFGMPVALQPPREVRFGLRLTF